MSVENRTPILSIRCKSDGFSFSLGQGALQLAHGEQLLSDAASLPDALLANLQAANLLTTAFDSVQVVLHLPMVAVVPNHIYRAADAEKWLAPLAVPMQGKAVRTDSVERFCCQNVYALPAAWQTFFETHLPQATLRHGLSELLDKLDAHGTQVWARSVGAQLEVAVAVDGRLQLANVLSAPTPEDAAYHVLNVYKQLDILNTTPLHLLDERRQARTLLSDYLTIE